MKHERKLKNFNMILLKKLQLNNFLSHEKTEIDFTSNEKALIDGASGAGKSSIFDAILWVLYGQGRADNRSLVRKGSKKGHVCLELTRTYDTEARTETVIITRSATSTGKHTLEVAIEQPDGSRAAYPLSGVRELQHWIDTELIGASYLLFINSVAYVQGNTESFVAQTAPKRKELLLEIVKAEDYDKYYENARKTLSSLENDQNRAQGQVIELEARLGPLQARISTRQSHIQAIADNSTLVKDIEPIIKDLEAKKASMSALLQTVSVLDNVLKTTLSDKETIENTLATKLFKVSDKQRLVDMLKNVPSYVTSIEETNIKLAGLRAILAAASEDEAKRNAHYAKKPVVRDRNSEMKRQEEQIDFLEKKEVCPSGDKCPYHSKTLEAITYAENEIKKLAEATVEEAKALATWTIEEATLPPATDLKTTIKEIGETETHLKNLESELAQVKSVQKDIDALVAIEAEIPALEKSLQEKKNQILETQAKKEEAEKAAKVDEVNTIDNDLLSAKSKLRLYNDNVSKATAMLESIDRDEVDAKEVETRVKKIQTEEIPAFQEKARKVAMVKEAFGSKGIETMVIDYLLPKLEDRINDVLGKLSDFRVRLDTQRKSADGESTIEGLFITILNELNEEMPFEAYSGGEKLKISVAISEALATMQRVGFRLFDETFIGLDENSTESFAEVLEGLQKNFSQVLVISHLLQIKELFDKKIAICKNKNISYVKQ